MPLFPGLCGELAATPYRLFLGTQPALAVEERLTRQLQCVYPWFASRRRVKEQANEFVELDLAACDAEVMLRYAHVYYVRRQIHEALLDKQLTLLETGKAPRLADNGLLTCLAAGNAGWVTQRLTSELQMLQQAKASCSVPGRRELSPTSPLEPHDYLCMMRVVGEDACGQPEAESQARAYLPKAHVSGKAQELVALLLGPNARATALERKEQKLLQRLIPDDYTKVGAVEKLRPLDVTTYFAYCGERLNRWPAESSFKRGLWGHVFRKYATHPSYLRGISLYWSRYTGLDPGCPLTQMPLELAQAVCLQQSLFPALHFRGLYLYTSPDTARRQWRVDHAIPLLRLFPVLGAAAAEHLAAAMAVEEAWARLELDDPSCNLVEERVVRAVRHLVEELAGLYDTKPDAVLKRVDEGVRVACPPVTAIPAKEAERAVTDDMHATP